MPSATLRERVIRGIGIVSCLYVNADTGQFWVIDYRLYDPAGDGKTKLDHLIEMLNHLVETKQLPFGTVLMDSWYAAQKVMERIDHWGKVYYCPLKVNRLVDDTGGVEKYKRIDPLEWNAHEQQHGKLIKVRGFPKDKKVKLFRVIVSTDKTDYVVTNDLSQASTDVVQQVCDVRWTIEEFHRELKQLTGVEACQCNHIACALLVWVRLKTIAYQTHQTIYRVKHRMLSSYLIEQLNLHYSQGQYKGSHSLDLRTQWEKLGDKLGQKSVNRTENRSKHANSLQIDTPIL
jgi:hypothetical protein